MWWFRVLLRFLEAACCLVALITVSSGFVVTSYYGYTSMLGSSPVTYMQLITYMGFLYALFILLLVETLGWFARPFWMFELVSDFLMAVMLLIAAIVLLISDYVMNCSVYGVMLRCYSLNTAVVFTFISMGLFVLSLLVSLFADRSGRDGGARGGTEEDGRTGGHQNLYHSSATPTAEVSPKNTSSRM